MCFLALWTFVQPEISLLLHNGLPSCQMTCPSYSAPLSTGSGQESLPGKPRLTELHFHLHSCFSRATPAEMDSHQCHKEQLGFLKRKRSWQVLQLGEHFPRDGLHQGKPTGQEILEVRGDIRMEPKNLRAGNLFQEVQLRFSINPILAGTKNAFPVHSLVKKVNYLIALGCRKLSIQ